MGFTYYIVLFSRPLRRTQSPVDTLSSPSVSKRPRLLPPHFYCSVNRDKPKHSFLPNKDDQEPDEEEEDEGSSTTATEDLDEELASVEGPGPRNNSTPRQVNAEANPIVFTPQTMPVSIRKTIQGSTSDQLSFSRSWLVR